MFWKRKVDSSIKMPSTGEEASIEDRKVGQVTSIARADQKPQFENVPAQKRRVAFVVFHGMGQQVPYETLSMLAECILGKQPRSDDNAPGQPVTFVRARVGDDPKAPPLSRVQFLYHPPPSQKQEAPIAPTEVHVYEAYWAPLTEGKISFLGTLTFLFSAAIDGVTTCLRGRAFKRWMFGDFQNLPIKRWTFLSLLSALGGIIIGLAPVALFYYEWKSVSTAAGWRGLLVTHPVLSLLSLGFLALYTWAVRYFLVEYVGDVAIYVSSHKVSSFEEIRTKIQEIAFSVLRQVYSAPGEENAPFKYDSIVIVGHSLGSLIAYDALNDAHTWDKTDHQGKMKVAERTRRLITFGSPLDKTAFLFRSHVSGLRFREGLAAQKQPLLLDYTQSRPLKTFSWVNIYSRADVISGPLQYYDTPPNSKDPNRNPVVNIADYRAAIPFLAHVQYWRHDALRDQLRQAIQS